jgi:hypothetical protein
MMTARWTIAPAVFAISGGPHLVTTSPFFPSPLVVEANHKGIAMAKLLGCRICMIELARIELADGSVALVCHACEVIGVEHEIARGGPMWAGGAAKERARSARTGR